MEVLNNVWTALSTPNEGLIKISSIPIVLFIENPLIMYMFIYSLNINANKNQKASFITLMSMVSILSSFIISSPYNIIFNYGMMFVLIYTIFKITFFKSFIAMIVPTAIIALMNVLLLNPFLTLLNIEYEQGMTIPIYRYLYLLSSYSLLLRNSIVFTTQKCGI